MGIMSNPDLALMQYLELATISQAKRQMGGRDRFLILAAVAACRAGWLDVAEICRTRVLEHNRHHMLSRWPTLPDAVRSEDFSSFHRQLERICSFEKAEMLLHELQADVVLQDEVSPGEQALAKLAEAVWDAPGNSLNEEPEPGESGKTA